LTLWNKEKQQMLINPVTLKGTMKRFSKKNYSRV
jgi:hypothetical protein